MFRINIIEIFFPKVSINDVFDAKKNFETRCKGNVVYKDVFLFGFKILGVKIEDRNLFIKWNSNYAADDFKK